MPSELEDAPVALTAKIFRNRGIPVDVHRTKFIQGVDEDEVPFSAWVAPVDDNDDPIVTTRDVKMDMNTMAFIEETWGGFDGFQEALSGVTKEDEDGSVVVVVPAKQVVTIRRLLAGAWEWPEERVGVAMIDGNIRIYEIAAQCALALANGVDPTQAATMWKSSMATARKIRSETVDLTQKFIDEDVAAEEAAASAFEAAMDGDASRPTDPSTGVSGSGHGSDEAEPTTSSGA